MGSRRTPSWTLTVVCTAVFMLLLDVTVVAVALSDIQRDFDADLAGLQWVVDAYTLPLAGLLLTAATLGDRLGRRRVFTAGMVVFTVGSLACAAAGSSIQLDLARAFQGVGGALLFGTALPLLAAAYPDPRRRAGAIGVFGATLAGALAVGPLIGGALVDGPGWRWIFLVNLPIGMAALVAAVLRLEESRAARPRRADWPGTALLTAGLLALLLGLIRGSDDGWTSAPILGLLLGAGVLIAGFLVREATAAEPMLDLGLFASRSFTGLGIAVFMLSATLIATTSYLALYVQNALGYSPFGAGLRFLPLTVAAFVAAPLAARFLGRVPPAITVAGTLALVALGMALTARLDGTSTWTVLVPGFVLAGVGLGAANAVTAQATLAAVEQDRVGMATGAINTLRQVGLAAGVAVLGVVFDARVSDEASRLLAGGGAPPAEVPRLADAIASGAGTRVADAVPAALAAPVADVARAATASGIDAVMTGGAVAGGVGAVLAFVLLLGRRRAPADGAPVDGSPAGEPGEPGEPVPGGLRAPAATGG